MLEKLHSHRYHRVHSLEGSGHTASSSPTRFWAILAFGVVTFIIGVLLGQYAYAAGASVRAWRILHAPSPVIDDIELHLNLRKLDNRLTGQTHILSQDPSSENDAAWENLFGPLFLRITEEELKRTGLDPNVALRLPSSHDYVAKLDITHELHCLSTLRKSVYWDYYFPNATADRLAWERLHMHHCLQVLLNSIICGATTDVTPFAWYEDSDQPNDFVLERQCINLDSVTQWGRDRALPDVLNPFDIRKPEGQETLGRIEDELLPPLIEANGAVR